MDGNSGHFEANLARLIRATVGGEARLSESKRESTLHLLRSEARPESPQELFPHRVLVPSGVILLLSCLWLGAVLFRNGPPEALDVPSLFVTLLVAVNLSCLPVSAALVLNRRRNHVHAA